MESKKGGKELTKDQKKHNLTEFISKAISLIPGENTAIYDMAYEAIHNGLLEKTFPAPVDLNDVISAFEDSTVNVFSAPHITNKKTKVDILRVLVFLAISAYGQGEVDGSSPIAPRLYEICSALEFPQKKS
jgi:hypothetical protein